MTRFSGFVQRTFKIQADETSLVLLSGLLFYTLMTCYNILKPIRDTMGLAGDAVGALAFKLLGFLGIGLAGTALVTVPLSLVWAGVGFFLGRRQKQLAATKGQ